MKCNYQIDRNYPICAFLHEGMRAEVADVISRISGQDVGTRRLVNIDSGRADAFCTWDQLAIYLGNFKVMVT